MFPARNQWSFLEGKPKHSLSEQSSRATWIRDRSGTGTMRSGTRNVRGSFPYVSVLRDFSHIDNVSSLAYELSKLMTVYAFHEWPL